MYNGLATIEEFVRNHGILVGGVGVTVIYFLYYGYQRRGFRLRQRRLSGREILFLETDWFRRFYPVADAARPMLVRALVPIAGEIGAHWSQLRPDDTFEEDLRIHAKYSPQDDLDDAEAGVFALCAEFAIKPETLPGFVGPLRNLLDGLTIAQGFVPPQTPDKTASAVGDGVPVR